uniref:INCENP_ARK-bind domain-containing protein n=1 Tax=Ascaris lumbricoides TaxID=6252 RepID=A0A0M3HG26_ASCLU
MTSVRRALYPINASSKTQSRQGKDSLKTKPSSKAQLRVIDVNRQAGEEASSELNESKCILVKSEKEEDKTPEVKGLQKGEVITKKEIRHSKDFKTRGLKSSKIIKETNEANERLTEEKSSLKAVEKKLERGEIRKETHHLEKDWSCTDESTSEACVQTEVTVNEDKSQLTVEDLISTTVSAAYWHALATKLESQLDEEIHNNFYVRGLDHVWHDSYFDGIE